MSIPFIDLRTQYKSLKPRIQERINAVLEHGQYIMGPEVFELEAKLEEYTGARHCITVSSGTDALLISLMALGVGAGDEVITTPFTFVATAEVIVLLGAKPVFVDIEPDTCNIDPAKIEEKISKDTKAILPVSLYGQPASMDEINKIADRHGLPVVEDAAQSFGATYKKRKSCNLSTIGCTSFFPSKPLGCYGDGGAIFTNNDELAQACREIRVHGQSERYKHSRLGIGGRMDTIQCATVLVKLEAFAWELEQRQLKAEYYSTLLSQKGADLKMAATVETSVRQQDRNLQGSPYEIRATEVRPDRTSVYAQYTIISNYRAEIAQRLTAAQVPIAVHYPTPINDQPAYRQFCCQGCTPISAGLSSMVISLPMGPYIEKEHQEFVIEQLFA